MNNKIILFTLFKIQDPENHPYSEACTCLGQVRECPPPPAQKHRWWEPLFVLLVAVTIEAKLQMFYLSTKDICHATHYFGLTKKKIDVGVLSQGRIMPL